MKIKRPARIICQTLIDSFGNILIDSFGNILIQESPVFVVYILVDPRHYHKIRYIGITSKTLEDRLDRHIRETKLYKNKNHRYAWIQSCLNDGILPHIIEIGIIQENWKEEEKAWIKYGREEGWDLVNGTIGGDGAIGCVWTKEQREAQSKRLIGKNTYIKTKQHRRKISMSIKWI